MADRADPNAAVDSARIQKLQSFLVDEGVSNVGIPIN